jgi:t-SNARE complex subunit (syntaxin)
MNLHDLLNRLKTIQLECANEHGVCYHNNNSISDCGNEFNALRRNVTQQAQELRVLIKMRNEEEERSTHSTYVVDLSHGIRKRMSKMKKDIEIMANTLKKEEQVFRKNPTDENLKQNLMEKVEMFDIVVDHMKECEILDKQRYYGDAILIPMQQLDENKTSSSSPMMFEIPLVDDEAFQTCQQHDYKMDQELDKIHKQVAITKEIAIQMEKESQVQQCMLENTENRTEKVVNNIENLNVRMKKALHNIRPPQKFCIDIILLILILGIVVYIGNIITTNI